MGYNLSADAQAAGFTDMDDAKQWLVEQGIPTHKILAYGDQIELGNRRYEERATALFAARAAATRTPEATPETATPAILATTRQVEYILDLVATRYRDGIAAGFMAGPTARREIAAMTRREASAYIDSLTERY